MRLTGGNEQHPVQDSRRAVAAASETCTECGRTYSRRHFVIRHELPYAGVETND